MFTQQHHYWHLILWQQANWQTTTDASCFLRFLSPVWQLFITSVILYIVHNPIKLMMCSINEENLAAETMATTPKLSL
jgi:hypothetical protein